MKAFISTALFLLGAAPLALAQGTSTPAPSPLDRSGMKEVEVVFGHRPGTVAPAPGKLDPIPVAGPVVTLPIPEVPGTVGQAPEVELFFVEPTMAFDPGLVELRGRNLHMIREVRVGGLAVPVRFNNGQRMLIDPGDQVPGFHNLELIRIGGKLDAKIEFTPCMTAAWNNGRARVQLHPGEQGWYIVQYSFRRLDTPRTWPGIYYGEMLDLTGTHCGTYCSGLTPDDQPMAFPWMRVPTWGGPSLVGPMSFQALCLVDGTVSYSNMVTLRPHM